MPKVDFKEDWGKGAAVLFPHYSELRNCARLLANESRVARHEGRVEEALESCRVGLQVSRSADTPILIGQLVRYAIIAIAYRELEATLQDSTLSPKACRRLAKEIGSLDLIPGYVEAIKGERAMGLWCFDFTFKSTDPTKRLAGLAEGSCDAAGSSAKQTPPNLLIRWWLAEDESYYLQLMTEQVRRTALPYREIARLPEFEKEAKMYGPFGQPHILTLIIIPVYEKGVKKRDLVQAELNLAQVALLLKAYRSDRGAYPDTLADLAKAEKVSLPLDPFSGKPLVYHREGEGFVLYSWSMNFKDDGGKAPKERADYEVGDLVLRCSR
jgi:hypothetical protein